MNRSETHSTSAESCNNQILAPSDQHYNNAMPPQDDLNGKMMPEQKSKPRIEIHFPADDNSVTTASTSNDFNSSFGNLSTGCINYGGNEKAMVPLADDFTPGDDDVICGRGKKCYNHAGNEKFRKIVIDKLDQYRAASSKLDKSFILSTIVADVRKQSPNGGFVKKDMNTGKWYEVGDFLAREKTSQAFRDALHENYRSSNKSKKKRRQEEQAKAAMVAANSFSGSSSGMSKFQRLAVGRTRSAGQHFEYMLRKSNYEFLTRQRQQQAAQNKVGGGSTAGAFGDEPMIQNQVQMMRLSNYNSFPNVPAFQQTSMAFTASMQQQQQQRQQHQQQQRQVQFHHSFSGPFPAVSAMVPSTSNCDGEMRHPAAAYGMDTPQQKQQAMTRGRGRACDWELAPPRRCPSPDNSISVKSAPAFGAARIDPYQRSNDDDEFAPLNVDDLMGNNQRGGRQSRGSNNRCSLQSGSANDILSRLSAVYQEEIPDEEAGSNDNLFEPIPIFEQSNSSMSCVSIEGLEDEDENML